MIKATFLWASLLILLYAGLSVAPAAAQTEVEPASGKFTVYLPLIVTGASSASQQVVALVNQERVKVGCPPLGISSQLTASAQGHSQDMALNDFFSHTGSNGSSPWDRMAATGYSGGAAENVAAGYATAAAVMAAWMQSPGHRANILNCGLRDIGIGF
jgi:uncharacterized protein YkwD